MEPYYSSNSMNPPMSLENVTSPVDVLPVQQVRVKPVGRCKNPKTSLSFPQLVGLILINTTTKALAVSEIYDIVSDIFPCYNDSSSTWKNSIRHNLSTKDWFEKIPQRQSDTRLRQSCIWGFKSLTCIRAILERAKNTARKSSENIIRHMRRPEDFDKFISGELMIIPKYCGSYRLNQSIPIEYHYKEFYSEDLGGIKNFDKVNNRFHYKDRHSDYYSTPSTSYCNDLERNNFCNYVEDQNRVPRKSGTKRKHVNVVDSKIEVQEEPTIKKLYCYTDYIVQPNNFIPHHGEHVNIGSYYPYAMDQQGQKYSQYEQIYNTSMGQYLPFDAYQQDLPLISPPNSPESDYTGWFIH
ncbi:DOMINA protein [Strongyloides ratti]|uniref:DOMINA protein n=1 Tax=Strongyloides ratti TaxID=34506 RepID=A0A090L519_STRRB|nr:DOMINA protein [Strongyloides ratti]CEF64812.1 DOMINA protein [Strongyloides ratti]